MTSRDRDGAGRARSARPRDVTGRPLPHGAAGVERVPEDQVLTADEAVTKAQRLLDGGNPFGAHEVLEGAWKAAPEPERELWRGLAQVAVGLTHAQRGNARGAVALLERGVDHVRRWVGDAPAGLDLPGVADHAEGLAARIAGGATATPDDLRPRLRAPTVGP
ncbi:DUF309 domain-containing protein [Pseudonocardia petroleophila]|uniref:DUF309 domain-containing protein n=1 Tax=Pseudonocardia petroleophila TaxID=37331 RepID=A0A7G7MFE6_9PSEU|nr:DUF309 domain-containing protein [Pseudonocardia petroleophila]QNG51507.1 DUF309 domain-containing protein [Pseudonocardia petroleophila]